jgi:hypothetical protein
MYIQSLYNILFHSAVMNSEYFATVTVGVIATILTIGLASTIYGQTNMTAGNMTAGNMTAGNMTAGNMTAGDTTSSGGGDGGDDGDDDNGSDDGEDDGEGGGSN